MPKQMATVPELETLILKSPKGHKYEVTVSDSGTLLVNLQQKASEQEEKNENKDQ